MIPVHEGLVGPGYVMWFHNLFLLGSSNVDTCMIQWQIVYTVHCTVLLFCDLVPQSAIWLRKWLKQISFSLLDCLKMYSVILKIIGSTLAIKF